GAGLYVEKEHPLNRSAKLPLYLGQSNQTGELTAVKIAAELVDRNLELRIETDSKYVITLLTSKQRNQRENDGYIGTANKALLRGMIASLRRRQYKTYFKWVKGHDGHERNEGADEMARKAVTKDKASPIHLSVAPTLLATGAKLSTMTQDLAYKASQEWSPIAAKRQRTNRNILAIKDMNPNVFKR
ncbi:ribonuclease H-like protein, partial [Dendrothele bispora CBS 962.96]